MTTPGWGPDQPLVRALRAIGVVALFALLYVVVLDPDREDSTTLAFLFVGAILLALGYPVVLNLPSIIGRREDQPPKEPKP